MKSSEGYAISAGKGVLAGLTDISEIISYTIEDNDMIPCEGRLFYRGYNIQDLVGRPDPGQAVRL